MVLMIWGVVLGSRKLYRGVRRRWSQMLSCKQLTVEDDSLGAFSQETANPIEHNSCHTKTIVQSLTKQVMVNTIKGSRDVEQAKQCHL